MTLPVVWRLFVFSESHRFVSCLRTLLNAGITMVPAIRISAATVKNWRIRNGLGRVVKLISDGDGLAASLAQCSWAPGHLTSMIEAGEQVGEMDRALSSLENFYDNEIGLLVESILALFEPLLIGFMGILVGAFLIGMISPLLTLFQSLGA